MNSVKSVIQKAFWDVVKNSVTEGTLNPDHLAKLFCEIKDRLQYWVRPGTQFHKEVASRYDKELFLQMINNNAFSTEDLYALKRDTYNFVRRIVAPVRDEQVNMSEKEVDVCFGKDGVSFGDALHKFLYEIHQILDNHDDDMKKFFKNYNKTK